MLLRSVGALLSAQQGGGSTRETVTFVDGAYNGGTTVTSLTIPAHNDDDVVVAVSYSGAAEPSLPSGWTDLATVGTSPWMRVYAKQVTAAETSISLGASVYQASCVVLRNADDPASSGITVGSTETGASTDWDAPAGAANVSGAMDVIVLTVGDDPGLSAIPSGFTTGASGSNTAGADERAEIYYATNSGIYAGETDVAATFSDWRALTITVLGAPI